MLISLHVPTRSHTSSPFALLGAADGNFCIQNTEQHRSLYCDMVSVKGPGDYFAILGDDCSFCVHAGVYPNADGGSLWCAPSSCPTSGAARSALDYPTSCTLQSWQAAGQDIHSVVADPLFLDAAGRDFSKLSPNSPALKLGFQLIDTSTVGPRPA
jgi:hypothetical protein